MTRTTAKPGRKQTAKRPDAKKPVAAAHGIRVTHPERVVYPEDAITKGDLAEYYELVAERMLPHVVDRPLTLVRCPEGLAGQCFFQRHPPPGMSSAVERFPIKEKDGTDTSFKIHDVAGLISLVQFGAMEIHAWGSLADRIEQPDRLVFDLDPGPRVAWKNVVETAFLFRKLLDKLGLASFVKTTGGKGLHVVVPIRPERDWDEIKTFCRDVAELLVRVRPEQFTANMSKSKRAEKIFLDYLRNDRSSTSVAAYSTRARPGAPVSLPVDWKELRTVRSSAEFTLRSVPARLKSRRADPWKNIAGSAETLTSAMLRSVRA